MLMQTMEEYANWGFHFMEDKLTDDPNYFYRETAFLELFMAFDASVDAGEEDDEPEPLDQFRAVSHARFFQRTTMKNAISVNQITKYYNIW